MNALHSSFLLVCFCFCLEISVADKKKLQIGVKKKIENCTKRSKKGDVLKMHYTVRPFFSSPLYRYDCLILYSTPYHSYLEDPIQQVWTNLHFSGTSF